VDDCGGVLDDETFLKIDAPLDGNNGGLNVVAVSGGRPNGELRSDGGDIDDTLNAWNNDEVWNDESNINRDDEWCNEGSVNNDVPNNGACSELDDAKDCMFSKVPTRSAHVLPYELFQSLGVSVHPSIEKRSTLVLGALCMSTDDFAVPCKCMLLGRTTEDMVGTAYVTAGAPATEVLSNIADVAAIGVAMVLPLAFIMMLPLRAATAKALTTLQSTELMPRGQNLYRNSRLSST